MQVEDQPISIDTLLSLCYIYLTIINYDHILCQTPLFRMWLGIVEYLFKNQEMFDAAIDASMNSKGINITSILAMMTN